MAWTPGNWTNGTSGDTTSDKFTGLNAPLAAMDQTVTVTPKHVRETLTLYQQPSAANNYTFILDFNDDPPDGAYWYEVSLEYTPGVPFQFLGFLEGIPNSGVSALNAKGQATGEAYSHNYLSSRAFFWDPKTGMRDLGAPPEWTHSYGAAINSKGQVTGQLGRDGLSQAFFWDPKTGMRDLGIPAEWTYSFGTAINSKGQVAGALLERRSGPRLRLESQNWHAGPGQPGLGITPGCPARYE